MEFTPTPLQKTATVNPRTKDLGRETKVWGFIHLHTHSHYSLLDGLAKIDELVKKAKENRMKALALTDHGVMYGVIEFYRKAKEAGLKPIIGVEVYLARYGRHQKRPKIDERPYHLVLLAKNKTGYQNLIKLTTIAHLEGFYYKPRIDFEVLKEHKEGLIALTACLRGEIPTAIINGQPEKAEKLIIEYQELFGPGNFYLELQHHPNISQQAEVNKKLVELGQKLKVPLVATNDIHYSNPEDAEAQDVLLCLQTKKKMGDKNRLCMLGEDFSFKPTEQMQEDFKDWPEAITNTQKIADQCNLELEFGKITLPHFAVPEGFSSDQYLKKLCEEGLKERYGQKDLKEAQERLNYELGVIAKTGFASYFLIVQDVINWAKENKIVVGPGRGSAAGSLVAYLTKITNIDPLKYELMFERFLNPERVSMPDIDIDFADTRRDEVIKYVEEKYGQNHVAQIITFGTMAARAVVRDVGRVLDFPYNQCDALAKLIPMFLSLDIAIKTVPELKEIYETDADQQRLLDLAKKLEGVARHASTHACGLVITKESLDHYLPAQFVSQDDRTVISQYSLHPIEDLGLLKMDFLGLKNLTILENALKIIQRTVGTELKLDEIPLNDPKTFASLQKGQTTGVFQLESSGMKRYLIQLKPTIFEDIIAMVALFRPGPMDWLPSFIDGKHKKRETKYLHPKLKPILEKTYGVAVYQEQVIEIARVLAGFSAGEADVLRKAIGKKIPKLLKEQREKFVKGCLNNKITKDTAEKIFNFIEPFASYGFNRAHAACYALIAYQTAYLKANWPVQFMASLLTSDLDNLDRIGVEVEECKQMGIELMPPDVNESFSTFTVVKKSLEEGHPRIRFGLTAIKNVGENIVKAIIEERKTNGSFKGLEDFLRRIQTKDLNKKSLESLIKSGSLDHFKERNQMFLNLEPLLTFSKMAEREGLNGQTNLFSFSPVKNAPALKLKETSPATKKQKLAWEKELLGLYVSEHPLEEYREYLTGQVTPIAEIKKNSRPAIPKIAGVITQIKRIITKSNEAMLFVKLEDQTGNLEILVFPSILKTTPTLWQEDKILIVQGRLSNKDGELKLLCEKAKELNLPNPAETPQSQGHSPAPSSESVLITLPAKMDREILEKLKTVLRSYPGPSQVYLLINNHDKIKKIVTHFFIHHNQALIEEIELLIGKNSISLKNLYEKTIN